MASSLVMDSKSPRPTGNLGQYKKEKRFAVWTKMSL